MSFSEEKVKALTEELRLKELEIEALQVTTLNLNLSLSFQSVKSWLELANFVCISISKNQIVLSVRMIYFT